ncbi:uncharacterized protein LOC134477512 [Cavia porcellus]|uniref:uncharacterized protein LOC134477512 n=1 Tax=Cavia porcellus TaxID=10141 RepID=UPI002FE2018D
MRLVPLRRRPWSREGAWSGEGREASTEAETQPPLGRGAPATRGGAEGPCRFWEALERGARAGEAAGSGRPGEALGLAKPDRMAKREALVGAQKEAARVPASAGPRRQISQDRDFREPLELRRQVAFPFSHLVSPVHPPQGQRQGHRGDPLLAQGAFEDYGQRRKSAAHSTAGDLLAARLQEATAVETPPGKARGLAGLAGGGRPRTVGWGSAARVAGARDTDVPPSDPSSTEGVRDVWLAEVSSTSRARALRLDWAPRNLKSFKFGPVPCPPRLRETFTTACPALRRGPLSHGGVSHGKPSPCPLAPVVAATVGSAPRARPHALLGVANPRPTCFRPCASILPLVTSRLPH